jgi:hypothetical protein
MSSSGSDEDRNVSQYDIEDDLNVYGSPVYSTQVAADNKPSLPAASHATHARTQVNNISIDLSFLVQSEEFTLQLVWLGKIQSRQVWCKQSGG